MKETTSYFDQLESLRKNMWGGVGAIPLLITGKVANKYGIFYFSSQYLIKPSKMKAALKKGKTWM